MGWLLVVLLAGWFVLRQTTKKRDMPSDKWRRKRHWRTRWSR